LITFIFYQQSLQSNWDKIISRVPATILPTRRGSKSERDMVTLLAVYFVRSDKLINLIQMSHISVSVDTQCHSKGRNCCKISFFVRCLCKSCFFSALCNPH